MNHRDLFNNIMHYGEFDRMPVWHWTGWPETMERWYGEGLPRDVDPCTYFDATWTAGIPVNLDLLPVFESEVLEETESYLLIRQGDGVIAQHSKKGSSIPHYVDFTFKDRSAWPEYERRLQPDPARIPENIDKIIEDVVALNRPIAIGTGSMIGFLRNWMGVENLAYTCYDDPELIGEVVDTCSTLVCWTLDQILPKVKVDMGWHWEDICFRSGPLVSPSIFRKYILPGYRRISDKLLSYRCDLHALDCDGKIDDLVPIWLEGGINVMFPIEIGTWEADPMEFRRKYGKELRVIGGINKLVLEKDRKAIDEEIELRKPLMADGGFVPLPDHLITPGTPLDNYKYYLDKIRELRF
ncbi:MAG: uroporphyrinogen decarboxylase family protein [Armatimonadota bacterium]